MTSAHKHRAAYRNRLAARVRRQAEDAAYAQFRAQYGDSISEHADDPYDQDYAALAAGLARTQWSRGDAMLAANVGVTVTKGGAA